MNRRLKISEAFQRLLSETVCLFRLSLGDQNIQCAPRELAELPILSRNVTRPKAGDKIATRFS